MASAEEDFPRGGPIKKTSEQKTSKTTKHHVEVDNLFETREPVVKKKKKAASKHEDEKVAKRQKTEGGLKLNTTASVDILHMKNLKVGTVMLGCVRELLNFEVVLGLPSGLKGYMPISGICDAYTKILSNALDSGTDLEELVSPSHLLAPGQLVRCVVSSLDLSKEGFVSLKLSINPKDVNKELNSSSLKAGMTLSGCVESVEDHGYLIDIGVSGTKAFLPKEKAKDEAETPKRDLKVGQYVTALLEEVKNEGRVVRLSVNPTAVNQACAETHHGWTLSNLSPGLMVQTCIKKVTAHGLIVTFLSSYTGLVDFMHIDPDKLSTYNVGDEVKARILYVDSSSRLVGLSLRSHLLPPGGVILDNVTSERIGEVLKGCKMTAVHHHSGAVMELPDGTTAFVHRSHLKESNGEFNPNRLLAQPEHTLRITDYSPIEQIHVATLRKAIIEVPFFSYQDIKPGQIVEGTVQSLEKYGMHVKISDHIKGLVPRIHLADIILTNPEKKYKEGMRVKCKVLSVDYQNKKITLTRKKALMETSLPLFLSYTDARVGLVSHGFIVCIKDFGCIVRFYGDVKGLVPTSELTSEPSNNPQSLFYLGQVVKAKVLKCDAENEKLLLSFKAVTQNDIEKVQSVKFDFEIGKKVEVIVRKKCQTGLEVSILPEEMPALLPTVHLSDHMTNGPLLWAGLQEGDTISNVVCLSRNKQNIILSKKPSLIAALEAENLVSSFSELQVGMVMVGWVKSIMSYGVFVDFPHGLFGLAPKAAMSDKFITDTAGVFEVGQTVLAKVTNLDEEKRRFLISLKVSEVSWAESDTQARLIQGQRERIAFYDAMSSKADSDLLQQLSSVSLGDKLKMTVDMTREDGSVLLTSDQLSHATVLASKYHVTDVNTTPGNQVTAVVLHVDFLTSEVHVSLLPKLTVKKKTLNKDSQHTATIQYMDKDFAVISLGDTGHLTVISSTTHLNEMFRFKSEKLSVGRDITVTVTEPSSEHLGGRSLVEYQLSPKKKSSTSQNRGEEHKYKIGDFVTAKIKTVKPLCVLVTLPDGGTGSVHVSQVHESPKVGGFPTSSLKVGTEVNGRVIGAREIHSHRFLSITHPNFVFSLPELTLLPSKLNDDVTVASLENKPKLESYKPGQEIVCYVSKYLPQPKCLVVAVSPNVFGSVELLAMINKPREANHPQKLFKHGQCVSAKVVGINPKKPQQLKLSLTGTHTLEKGVVTMGMVRKIIPQMGLILNLPFGNSGLACITDLTDEYVDAPFEQYKEGQVVRCCVTGEKDGKFQVSLRLSRIHSGKALPVKDVDISSVSELQEGQIIQGYVKNVGEKGIFVRLSRSVTGRVLFQYATNYFASDSDLFPKHVSQNALLTTKVLHIDAHTGHVDLSLLPEDTGKADILPESLGLPLRLRGKEKEEYDKKNATKKRKMSESKQNEAGQPKKLKKEEKDAEIKKKKQLTKEKEPKKEQAEDQDSGVEVYFREKDKDKAKKKGKRETAAPEEPGRLQVASDFSWDIALSSLKPASSAQNAYESSDDEQEDHSKTAKKSRREAEMERKEAELRLSKLEAELMEPSARPESAEAFERLLLSSPDSSLLWLQYMAFQLQATQIEQARAVAERALKTISFREEQEKLNVWVALLNLENMYGTEESLQKVFERAIQYCEPLPVYQQLADIYAKSNKIKEAENLYKNMVKRFKQEKAVWQSYGSFLLRQGQSDAANALLQRALQSLSNKEHVDLIVKFARLEFQYGNEERAKAMFEKVLSSYPKRTDLWSVFIDLMMKHGSQKDVRALFDRVVHLSVSVKKIKFFFKRYLDYEKKHGTPESIQAVKQKAVEYVESKGTDAAN
ncbi:protein RRP5 homolog [Pangasianodon hypophthalmus]|uniref:protein RRP5 homolog n=1 Tax=Pangasianodon hypophthalmus TaxID=310915 RepID=UPI0023081185|nr:protein RRP5 homolog [Pangasianodon hypophthalmus]XP_034155930.2 protein RRP5 homolog [Pangasianodon hypophthalmus]